ncbi:TadE/TadG family type IV pilus assembly protein [Wenxinia saemankumensis]|uniref:Flp pilus assembly protein TadG n=1 Tax=Wenxinia saemankumensis TaxID=1447782 RepID=A0A1M6GZJ8_9RHOB|nr:hypothetical protein [Wenxinia saemankumensis]SHJ15350.1 hypothetical protein SAMN05444417_3019 [Wenxinia saemankumensis]
MTGALQKVRAGLGRFAGRFLRRSEGTVTVELVMGLPMVVWAMMAGWVYYDSFRTEATNTRAAYTIGDALSRETNFISPVYMNSLSELQGFLLQSDQDRALRVTVVRYEQSRDRHRVVWSQVRGTMSGIQPLQNADIAAHYDRIPITSNAGRMILVESWLDYEPDANVGLDAYTFYNFTATRPRFAGQLCWNSNENGDLATSTC